MIIQKIYQINYRKFEGFFFLDNISSGTMKLTNSMLKKKKEKERKQNYSIFENILPLIINLHFLSVL